MEGSVRAYPACEIYVNSLFQWISLGHANQRNELDDG
jgi:hypothetical protein